MAALVFGGIGLSGVFMAIGGFTWAVCGQELVRLPVVVAGAAPGAGGFTFLSTLRAGWREGWPPHYDPRTVVGGFFLSVAGAALAFL